MDASAKQTKDQAHRTHRKGPGANANQKSGASRKGTAKTRAGKKARGAKAFSLRELGRQLSQELLKLRPIIKDAGTALLDRLDGELAGLASALNGGEMPGETPVLPKASVLSAMLTELQALKLKPKKGRVKDLRRIEALLESLSARIPPEI